MATVFFNRFLHLSLSSFAIRTCNRRRRVRPSSTTTAAAGAYQNLNPSVRLAFTRRVYNSVVRCAVRCLWSVPDAYFVRVRCHIQSVFGKISKNV